MQKRKHLKSYTKTNWFKWAMVIVWMLVIFIFSSQNAEASSHNNRFMVEILKSLGIDLDTLLGSSVNFIVRKLAHMTEYFILMLLSYNALKQREHRWKTIITAFFIAVIYASTDEIHQYFIPGRACMLRDVGIDSIGAFIGALVILIRNSINISWSIR